MLLYHGSIHPVERPVLMSRTHASGLSKESSFFIYLLEHFAAHRSETTAGTYDRLDKAGLLDYDKDIYELYHVEPLDNFFANLDAHLRSGLYD